MCCKRCQLRTNVVRENRHFLAEWHHIWDFKTVQRCFPISPPCLNLKNREHHAKDVLSVCSKSCGKGKFQKLEDPWLMPNYRLRVQYNAPWLVSVRPKLHPPKSFRVKSIWLNRFKREDFVSDSHQFSSGLKLWSTYIYAEQQLLSISKSL
jgi:hypothetical protein